jgi:hypothetical protein
MMVGRETILQTPSVDTRSSSTLMATCATVRPPLNALTSNLRTTPSFMATMSTSPCGDVPENLVALLKKPERGLQFVEGADVLVVTDIGPDRVFSPERH